MAFAGRSGLDIYLDNTQGLVEELFAEELGVVIQVRKGSLDDVRTTFEKHGLSDAVRAIADINGQDEIRLLHSNEVIYQESRARLQEIWSEVSFRIQSMRDNPSCAQQEFDQISADDPGLSAMLSFDPNELPPSAISISKTRPRMAILREQGVNGQLEMAAAFDHAGFDAIDVHMSDLISGRHSLSDFIGMVACGGFSYGDVLGAGEGWAKTILFNTALRDQFEAFFDRDDSFSLGVCNGCQMMSNLRQLIPGADTWPRFVRNESEQFEARVALLKIENSPSILFEGMAGSVLPVPVAHGEGRAEFSISQPQAELSTVSARYVDAHHKITQRYPFNPNGSPEGIAALTSDDGRVTIMMPHPERAFRTVTNSWYPEDWGEDGPWMKMFRNARSALG